MECNVITLTETCLSETNADVYGLSEQEQSETAWYAHLPASVNALLVYCA